MVNGCRSASNPPQAEISNGLVHVKLYLPDSHRGYYRGTRFDWSGVIYSLKYDGHEYFGQWFEDYNPKNHNAIMGPVEEFRTDGAGLRYTEAKVGETFIRIGVGVVRKPEEPAFSFRRTYEMVDPGKWTVRTERDSITFTHRLADETGYAYEYRKTVRLVKGKPVLVLEHSLKNTGQRAIETIQYNHNYFMIDGQPTGPDFSVKFPFELRADPGLKSPGLKDMAEMRGREISYLREIEKGETAGVFLAGFGETAADNHITIENRKVGAGVRIRGDRPLWRVYLWSIRTTLCPEPHVDLRVAPGAESTWKSEYEFYTLPVES